MHKLTEIETVFFDFDNTISLIDVLDDIIQRFSINTKWQELEEAWVRGKIGSRECLERQLSGVRATREELEQYLKTVEIDAHFKPLLKKLAKAGLRFVITSDSFLFIIQTILKNNGITDIPILCNDLQFKGNRWILSFPHFNEDCLKCANCKTRHLPKKGAKKNLTVYVGDGRSDICPAESCDIVFAKATLLKHFKNMGKKCIPFQDLSVVSQYFK